MNIRMLNVAAIGMVLGIGATAVAQPADFVDLGRFDDSVSRTVVQEPVFIDANTPVRWYKVVLPRIADPYRYLDIMTYGQFSYDTEIALYSSDGELIATDDDDGASFFSSLTFGMTDVNALQRVVPPQFPGQSIGVPNDGRDGTLSGPANDVTTATYYIALTEYDVEFLYGFEVQRTAPPAGLFCSFAVRYRAPGDIGTTTVNPQPVMYWPRSTGETVRVTITGPVQSVRADLREVGFSQNTQMQYDENESNWFASAGATSNIQAGPHTLTFYARTPIDDVVSGTATVVVMPRNHDCDNAFSASFELEPGSQTRTYDTSYADVDGNWAGCSTFSPDGNDVWFEFDVPSSGRLTISTCNSDTGYSGAQPDTLLGIANECGMPFFACVDDTPGCDFGSRLTNLQVQGGSRYSLAVRAYTGDITDGVVVLNYTPDVSCDSIDFNNDTSLFDPQDIEAFLSVYSEGPCIPEEATCNDIDFNNDGSLFDPCDINSYLLVFSEGPCTLCGV